MRSRQIQPPDQVPTSPEKRRGYDWKSTCGQTVNTPGSRASFFTADFPDAGNHRAERLNAKGQILNVFLAFPVHHSLGACCPNRFPLRMWGRHSCLPVLGTFQSPDSASNCQLWSAKLENFATGRLERPPYNLGNTPLGDGGSLQHLAFLPAPPRLTMPVA